ncbi:hypothetical protein SAMN05444355_11129 [Flavobacterium frigoris]|uniref:Uncharacterized protein n=1 Tax=Flavobacterium frigoris TaxID=229204 RepID=A0A1H9NNI0_FLAFI|nr:hypothetical protein SAMN05444355_11129 [Flavobacterium frigoris]
MLILHQYFGNYLGVKSFRTTFAPELYYNPLWKYKEINRTDQSQDQ